MAQIFGVWLKIVVFPKFKQLYFTREAVFYCYIIIQT